MLWDYSKPKGKKAGHQSVKAWLYLPQEKVAYTQKPKYFSIQVFDQVFIRIGKIKR